MMKVEKQSKVPQKLMLYLTKILPMLIALLYLLNTTFSFMYIDIPAISYIYHFLLIAFIYSVSYALKFCAYHRMFIHYILIEEIINIIDYEYGIPLDYIGLVLLHSIILVVCLFLVLYLKFKVCEKH